MCTFEVSARGNDLHIIYIHAIEVAAMIKNV